ncbi:hypothetical protein PISMIDRAFT_353818 [Pisolithus microcarpus 441]|uniref:Unplaced genomic scaffold scaffold_26, whole genome shotgun sequence n=1 Tax=Pisolithus microcarpus 441 TaxID=765257 RepID=A0A0C9ZZF0_9AGAM|nr:hypothetical protein PISMIDRAFT_353818 [Pisolithus microcarpus 441]
MPNNEEQRGKRLSSGSSTDKRRFTGSASTVTKAEFIQHAKSHPAIVRPNFVSTSCDRTQSKKFHFKVVRTHGKGTHGLWSKCWNQGFVRLRST